MSSFFAATNRRPRRTAPTATTVLTVIALTLWLVVLPLQLAS